MSEQIPVADGKTLAGLVIAAVGLLLVAAGVLFGMEYGLHELGLADAVLITLAVIAGIALLLFVLMAMVVVYGQLGLTAKTEPLGFPPESVRALLAFTLLVVFVGIAIYLISADKLDDNGQAAASLLGTVGTLAVTVAAFYFGTSAVKTGASAVAQFAAVKQPPTADTKGSEPVDAKTWRLIGFVNPNGAETRVYFEYGEAESRYDSSTPVQTISGERTTQRVTVEAEIPPETYFRIVAHNENGQAVGRPDRTAAAAEGADDDGDVEGAGGGGGVEGAGGGGGVEGAGGGGGVEGAVGGGGVEGAVGDGGVEGAGGGGGGAEGAEDAGGAEGKPGEDGDGQ